MPVIFQSAFLQALGYAIANSLWQMALLWLIYILGAAVLKPRASRKYIFAVVLQSIGFLWFIITFHFYYGAYNRLLPLDLDTGNTGQITTLIPPGTGIKAAIVDLMIKAETLLPYLSTAYLILMIFLCIRWVMGYRYTQLIRKDGLVKIPVEWRLFVQDTARHLGITREVSIYLSEKIASPLTIGFLKPLILVPVASINHLSMAQLEAILLHELAHIKRYDYLVNIILSVTEIGLFFNPFTRLLSKHIRKERENSCDDWVLQFKYSAATYAEALLRMAQLQATPAFAMAASGNHENELLSRVKRMIGKSENKFNYKKQLLSLVVVTGILSSIAWLNPEKTVSRDTIVPATITDSTVQPFKEVQPVAIEPMAVKVTNPLFNPAFFLSASLRKEVASNLKKASEEIKASLNSQEVKDAIQQVPVILQDTYQKLHAEKLMNLSDLKQEMAKMEKAEQEMQQAYKVLDTASMPSYVRKPFKDGFEQDMKKMQQGLKEAKLAISKEVKNVLVSKIDQEKISREIETAIKTIGSLGLDKLVSDQLSLYKLIEVIEKIDQKAKMEAPAPPAKPAKVNDKDKKQEIEQEEVIVDNALPIPITEWKTQPVSIKDKLKGYEQGFLMNLLRLQQLHLEILFPIERAMKQPRPDTTTKTFL